MGSAPIPMEVTSELTPPQSAPTVPACPGCGLRSNCGGLGHQITLYGCFSLCVTECRDQDCDWTCPNNRGSLWNHRWGQVGGWPALPAIAVAPLKSPSLELPFYVPQIHHATSRKDVLHYPVVAVPTFCVVGRRRNGDYGVRDADGAALRERLGVAPEAQILLVSVAPDEKLELYWRFSKSRKTPEALANLGIVGITSPNYTSFRDVPRTHNIWNRTRIMRTSEALSAAGVPVIPHLNASTMDDWRYWADLLKAQPQINTICKEFQTGLALHEAGKSALDRLNWLQEDVGRELHLVAVGASRYAAELSQIFSHLSLVDSVPFFKTIKRRVFTYSRGARPKWVKQETAKASALDAELESNIRLYGQWLQSKAAAAPRVGANDEQLILPHIPL